MTAPAELDLPAEPTEPVAARDDAYYLHRAPVWRSLVHLAIPMMAALGAGVVYNVVNAGFVGTLHSTALLAALTFGLPMTALVMAVAGVFGTGGATAVGRLLGRLQGADDETAAALRTRIRTLSSFTVWGAALTGVLLGGLGLAFLHPFVALLGATGDAAGPTAAYVGVLLAGMPVTVCAFAMEVLVRSEGAARASMVGIAASAATNLVLDVLFILALGWGVAGAAAAVVGSNAVVVGYFARYLHRRSPELSMSPRWFRPDRAQAAEVLGVGVSELFMGGFMAVSAAVFTRVAGGYGDAALAAFGLGQRLVQVPEMLAAGVTLGAMPLFAASFGAGASQRLRTGLRQAATWIAVLVVAFGLPVALLRDDALRVFSSDPAVLRIGLTVLAAQLVAALFNGFTALVTTLFQATAQAGPAAVMGVTQGLLVLPVMLAGNALFGLTGLVWSVTVAEVACFALAMVLLAARRARTFAPRLA